VVEFRLLGPLEAVVDGVSVTLGPPQQRALLALLLLNANELVSRDRIVDELWGKLRDLEQAILRQDPALERTQAAEPAPGPERSLLVGRERELAALVGALDDALAGSGRLTLLAGEPGIGKSRLAEELGRQARQRGARVCVGRCWEAGGAPAVAGSSPALGFIRKPRSSGGEAARGVVEVEVVQAGVQHARRDAARDVTGSSNSSARGVAP
jgi:hypothetical protein